MALRVGLEIISGAAVGAPRQRSRSIRVNDLTFVHIWECAAPKEHHEEPRVKSWDDASNGRQAEGAGGMVAPLQGLTRYLVFPGFHPGLSHSVPLELNCEPTFPELYKRRVTDGRRPALLSQADLRTGNHFRRVLQLFVGLWRGHEPGWFLSGILDHGPRLAFFGRARRQALRGLARG